MKRILLLSLTAILTMSVLSCGHKKGTPAPEEDAAVLPPESEESADSVEAEHYVPGLFDIVTDLGTIRVQLYEDTPLHRDNFASLVRRHFYDGVLFHRVISDFMIQTGDPFTKDTSMVARYGEGGPGYTISPEILPQHTHKKGAVAAARLGDYANPRRESSGSQFYIVLSEDGCRHLDGGYTVFGETVSGLVVVDKIGALPTNRYDFPLQPVHIITVNPVKEEPEPAPETVPEPVEGVEGEPEP